jgi:hypothetical protein
MHRVRLLLVLVLTLSLTGCLNSGTLIKVKLDGSGTIEQSILMNTAALKGVMAGLGAQGQMKPAGPFTDADFKKIAESLGKGVRFVSSTPLSQGGFDGAKALFAFDDISGVRVQQDPSAATPLGAQRSPRSPVAFVFARQASSSVLTVTLDDKELKPPSTPSPPQAPPKMDPAMMQMMKQILQGFRIGVDLEVDGTIVKTNADYVNGSRITLLEVDLAGVLEDEAKLQALQGKMGGSLSDLRSLLKDVKGVKINHPVVTVEYR